MTYLGQGCPNLESVSFYACSLDDSGIQILSQYCSKISSWDLTECRLIRSNGLHAIATSSGLELRKLHLRGNLSIIEIVLEILSQHCSRLLKEPATMLRQNFQYNLHV
jgi:hypothetical protein